MSPMAQKARSFALAAHGDQQYGDAPYSVHLDAVAELVRPFGEIACVIGYLHDAIEDTPVSAADIEREFGPFVARCVELVTDEPGENRKERKAKTYAKLATVGPDLSMALVVKTADRLANVEACIAHERRPLLKMYKGERTAFRDAVYRDGLCDELWLRLEAALRD